MLLLKQKITSYLTTNLIRPYPSWVEGSTYSAKERILFKNHIYQSIVDFNKGIDPSINSGKWLLMGVSNAYASIDTHSRTNSIANPDTIENFNGSSNLKLSFSASGFDILVLRGIHGANLNIKEYDSQGALLLNTDHGIVTPRTCANTWYDYFYCGLPAGLALNHDIVHKLHHSVASVSIEITELGGYASLDTLVGGTSVFLGATEYSPKIRIVDYSIKDYWMSMGSPLYSAVSLKK